MGLFVEEESERTDAQIVSVIEKGVVLKMGESENDNLSLS